LITKCSSFPIVDTPSEPNNLKVTKVSPTSVDLEWKPPTLDGGSKVTAYRIFKATTPGDWEEVGKVTRIADTFSVPNLKDGESYYFAVAAENEAGLGPKVELDRPVKAQKPSGRWNT